jgi:hypothetical protein
LEKGEEAKKAVAADKAAAGMANLDIIEQTKPSLAWQILGGQTGQFIDRLRAPYLRRAAANRAMRERTAAGLPTEGFRVHPEGAIIYEQPTEDRERIQALLDIGLYGTNPQRPAAGGVPTTTAATTPGGPVFDLATGKQVRPGDSSPVGPGMSRLSDDGGLPQVPRSGNPLLDAAIAYGLIYGGGSPTPGLPR